MTYRKFGLGLVLAAIGMMAFASSAQALLNGFLINKKAALHASVGAEQVGLGYLLVPGLNLEVGCEKFTVDEGLITSDTHAKARLLFEECEAYALSDLKLLPCHIMKTFVDEKLTIEATALLLPAEILTTNAPAILAEDIKALIIFLGPSCVLPEDNTVTGELCLAIANNDTVKPLVLASNTIQGTCKPRNVLKGTEQSSGGVKDKILYGAQEANVDLTAHLFLTGAHAGLTLGVSLIP